MSYEIEKDTLYLGWAIAQEKGLEKGDTVTLAGRSFQIAHYLTEKGTIEDLYVMCHIDQAQELLHLPGRIRP